jgi:hypothetical protein
MKKLISFFILSFAVICYAQTEDLDKMELKDGKVIIGKVEVIKTDVVDFRESENNLLYETSKKDISYILLSTGKVLTFDVSNETPQNETQPTQQQPVIVEKDDGPSTGLIILATVGVVLIVLLIIGAAAQ